MTNLAKMGANAQAASRQIGTLSTETKNGALHTIAAAIEDQQAAIMAGNAKDVDKARANGMKESLVDRLILNEKRIMGLANDTRNVATLPDPVGTAMDSRVLPNGLRLTRRRIPLGVVGVIYENRPNVTVDISTLCLKTGNAVILRGSSSAFHSNQILTQVIQSGLETAGIPAAAVQTIDSTDRALVKELLTMDQYVDMIVPRGGGSLHKLCRDEATIPVITGGIGICHIFVDESADFAAALDIIENSKIQKPGACNSLDTLLVHQNIAGAFLPQVAARLAQSHVEIHAHDAAYDLLGSGDKKSGHGAAVVKGTPSEFDTEWLGMTVNAKVVTGVAEAIEHVQTHSMDHSDSILTNDWRNAEN